MRLCWLPFIRERSGESDLSGMGLVVYELAGKLSRAFSSSALAACIMAADVLGRVVRFGDPGFSGNGGGARSGSALSHMGIARESEEKEWEWRTSSRSREGSRSEEGIVMCGVADVQHSEVVEGKWNAERAHAGVGAWGYLKRAAEGYQSQRASAIQRRLCATVREMGRVEG